jgi:hypothetical protein
LTLKLATVLRVFVHSVIAEYFLNREAVF